MQKSPFKKGAVQSLPAGPTSGFWPTDGAMSPRSAAATVSASLGVCCHTQRLPKRPTYSYTAVFACACATRC
jgi:hypothetical protein